MKPYRYQYPLKVRWSEVDGQGIVFNANYLMYLDLAYQEYLRRAVKVSEGMPKTVLAKSTLTFKASAKFDDDLKVSVHTANIGRTSMTVQFRMTREDDLLFEAENIYVYVDDTEHKPIMVPNDWRNAIADYEQGR